MKVNKISLLHFFVILSLVGFPAITAEDDEKAQNLCPAPLPKPQKFSFPKRAPDEKSEKAPDLSEDISNISTDIVNNDLFTSKETLFNFIKLVYEDINTAISKYKDKNELNSDSISLVFKGGNVLRMVANRTFDLLPEDAKNLLKEHYEEFFKRSDSDFSVYVDESKLDGKDWHKVFEDMTALVNTELNNIRQQFMDNPGKYFDLMKLGPKEGSDRLDKYLKEVSGLEGLKDKKNEWFNTNFKQLQLLDYRANPESKCSFQGQYDNKLEITDTKLTLTPTSTVPHWIVNTDNRGIEDLWKSDPTKKDKFNLGKARVVFEYTYIKNGKLFRKPFGGELIDISIIHKDDNTLREFLDSYERNVALYTLTLDTTNESFQFRAHSVPYLARNLRSIIFDTFDRPWNTGPKYTKRINRIFFLSIVELLGAFGLGSEKIRAYEDQVRDKLIKPMSELYSSAKDSKKIGRIIGKNARILSKQWPAMSETNAFWLDMARLINSRLLANPEEKDQEEFNNLLKLIKANIDTTEKLSTMPTAQFNIDELYKVNMRDLL